MNCAGMNYEFLVSEVSKALFFFHRKLPLTYSKETKVKGIKTYRFELAKEAWDATSTRNDKKCYCLKKKLASQNQWCNYRGISDMGPCQKSAPIWASPPHFFNGDTRLLQMFEGLVPDYDKHQIIADVEPVGYKKFHFIAN